MLRTHNETGRSKDIEHFAQMIIEKIFLHFFSSLEKLKQANTNKRRQLIARALRENQISPPEINEIVTFITKITNQLAGVTRTGWNKKPEPDDIDQIKERLVANAEDVKDHSYGIIYLCLIIAPSLPEINLKKLLKTASVHDLPEKITGDIVTAGKKDSVGAAAKKRLQEEAAMKTICANIGEPLGSECHELWLDYENKRTPEADIAYQLDKLEVCLQAYSYSLIPGNKVDPMEFLETNAPKITHPILAEVCKQLKTKVVSPQT